MITQVEIPVLITGAAEVTSDVESTGAVVAGGAPAGTALAPAAADEASALAVVNTSAHTAQFLAVAAQLAVEQTRYAKVLGATGVNYGLEDAANASMFL
ncbi:PE domain-containing protein [Mycolicibacterium sp. XJ870]